MDLMTTLYQAFKGEEQARVKEIFVTLKSKGICTVGDLYYVEEISFEGLFPVEKKKLIEMKELLSLTKAVEHIFGKQDSRLDLLEIELKEQGIIRRSDIPFVNFSCLGDCWTPLDKIKLERFIRKEYPHLYTYDYTNQTQEEIKFHALLDKIKNEQSRLDITHKYLSLRLGERKLILQTLLKLESALIDTDNKVDLVAKILNEAPGVALSYLCHPVCGVACTLLELIKFFGDANQRKNQKVILKNLLDIAKKELDKNDAEVERIQTSIRC